MLQADRTLTGDQHMLLLLNTSFPGETAAATAEQSIGMSATTRTSKLSAPILPADSRNNTTTSGSIAVPFVVTITSCEVSLKNTIPFQIVEAASVLQFSVARSSNNSKYQPVWYAIHHPDAAPCAAPLASLGFVLQPRSTPVAVEEIRGDFLRERIVKNGCCGERELIKLEAWTFDQYPVAVLLDLDVLVQQPLDGLLDLIVLGSQHQPPHWEPDDLLWHQNASTLPEQIDLLYTTDYGMVQAKRKVKPTQGGFVVLRPSRKIYNDFVEIVREGDFRDNGGWHGKTGKFWGAMTFQVNTICA